VTLPITFGDVSNYCTKMLAFKVVDFSRPYHIILGWPCYVKLMTIASYACLNLKIPELADVITMKAKTQQALDCEQNIIELATTTAKLRELCFWVPPASTGLAMPSSSSAFKVAEDAKVMQIDTEDPSKTVQIGVGINPK
jgi:hypothetical protein